MKTFALFRDQKISIQPRPGVDLNQKAEGCILIDHLHSFLIGNVAARTALDPLDATFLISLAYQTPVALRNSANP